MKQNNNLFRPQVYFQRKEEIDLIKEDFIKNGNNNKSQYFHDLIMLGLKTKNEPKKDDSSILDSIDFKIDALLGGLESMNDALITKEEKDDLFERLKQLSFDLAQIKNKLTNMDNRLSIHEKVLANIYQFTVPTFGSRKNIENGDYDKLPERFYR